MFNRELARNSPGACAKSQPRRELLHPHARPDECQVGDVDATDQKHEERPPHIKDKLALTS